MYRKRSYRRRRRMTTSTALVPKGKFGVVPYVARGASRASIAAQAAELAYTYGSNVHRIAAAMKGTGAGVKPLKQTSARARAYAGSRLRKPRSDKGKKRGAYSKNPKRHEKLKMAQGAPMNKGKGFNRSATGVIVTHPTAFIPKWKKDRIYKYKYDVWQTVLLSKSSRLAASNNTLKTMRHPIKAPETLDTEKTQTMLFTPFCSNLSGVHTTYFRKVASSGTALDHDTTQRLDVIQNKADIDRFRSDSGLIEANDGSGILYAGTADAATVAGSENLKHIFRRVDQLVKEIHLDLVFMASRAFPVQVSVSVIRAIKPQLPYHLTTDNTRELCNAVDNHGIDYNTYKTEYHHTFTLPALRVNKKIPTYSVNKILKCNFLQTNSFNENTTASDMSQAAATALGSNIHSHVDEIADGNQSGNFFILIKYRKVQQPQQFTYTQTIEVDSDSTSARIPSATVSLPVVTEESFDVPTHDGITGADSSGSQFETGAPLTNNQGDEGKASFYLNGKLKYKWGFRKECEAVPSIMSFTDSNSNYKKPLSLNIDPTYDQTDTTNGIYQQSPDHVNIAASTANTGI